MGIVLLIGTLVLGFIFYGILHKMFNIVYFGYKGIFGVWFGCTLVAFWVMEYIIDFVTKHYGWTIGGIVALVLIIVLVKRRSIGKSEDTFQSE